jgi:hypothetical protein
MEDLDIEWDKNFALPVANRENKLLEETIAKKLNDKTRYQNELTENTSKVNALREHIKYVRDEILAAQVIIFRYLKINFLTIFLIKAQLKRLF